MPHWVVRNVVEKILQEKGAVESTASGRARVASPRRRHLRNSMRKGPCDGCGPALLEEAVRSPCSQEALSLGLWWRVE